MRCGTPLKILLAATLVFVPRASPHRLDELLQALRIRLSMDRLELTAYLTPGITLADSIFARADTDGNETVSSAESETFTAHWLANTTVTLDGAPVHLRLQAVRFPSRQELGNGEGAIRMDFEVPQFVAQAGHHQLFVRNDNDPSVSIYLANAVLPASREIAITGQNRNATQSEYTLDYEVGPSRSYPVAEFLAGVAVAVGAVSMIRRRAANQNLKRACAPPEER